MNESLSIGSVPSGEDCEQLGPGYRPDVARKQCLAFKHMLERLFPPPPNCRYKITRNPHDFGDYFDVECLYSDEAGADWAFKVESEAPESWDEEAKKELGI